MDKRYQVFVSSTYEDLKAERQEVMHALLELDCIPSGMELFPAANEDQWTLIKKVIDECDYYLVICGGRYGSLGPHGYSYTEMEYRYALESGKPVIAFLHKDPQQLPVGRCEQTDEGRNRLKVFRDFIQQKMCKFWDSPADLGSVVSRSFVRLTKTNPAVGWVRADQITDTLVAAEVLKLRKNIEDLESKLREARLSAPIGSERLSQGSDLFNVEYKFESVDQKSQGWTWTLDFDVSWNHVFYDIGPLMIDEATESELRQGLNKMVRERSRAARSKEERLTGHKSIRNFEISEHDLQTIKIQLRALGLIAKSEKARSVKDPYTYWTLTPYGDQVLTTLRAIPKEDETDEMDEAVEQETAREG
ncbi:MAG: DUF4062 domain-containing protein [Gammaproteobacteria bacterium]|nr:DUF4062 domain-containing protein [Gammaproteobacteria bacterium]MBU1777064.1 DUF4062 domain-containing protein [Gammaproteobacteria bacterium]MBU1969143.1 DUF4062 domain-containing protein [Gammaproteobacteria bacterium]